MSPLIRAATLLSALILGMAGPISALREVIAIFNRDTERGDFPPSLNRDRVCAVEDAIRSVETATTQPDLRSVKR